MMPLLGYPKVIDFSKRERKSYGCNEISVMIAFSKKSRERVVFFENCIKKLSKFTVNYLQNHCEILVNK